MIKKKNIRINLKSLSREMKGVVMNKIISNEVGRHNDKKNNTTVITTDNFIYHITPIQ